MVGDGPRTTACGACEFLCRYFISFDENTGVVLGCIGIFFSCLDILPSKYFIKQSVSQERRTQEQVRVQLE